MRWGLGIAAKPWEQARNLETGGSLGRWGRWGGLPRTRVSRSGRQGSLRLRPLKVAPAAQRLTPPALLPGRKVRDAERESACGRGTPG